MSSLSKGHRDSERVGRELVVPLPEFEGGGVRAEDDSEPHVISLQGGPQFREAEVKYTVLPWKGDDRVMSTAFSMS